MKILLNILSLLLCAALVRAENEAHSGDSCPFVRVTGSEAISDASKEYQKMSAAAQELDSKKTLSVAASMDGAVAEADIVKSFGTENSESKAKKWHSFITDTKWWKKISQSLLWRKLKFRFAYWKRQLRGEDDAKFDDSKAIKRFKKLGMKAWSDVELNDEDRERASRALQYGMIARQATLLYPTPRLLDGRTGLCDTYRFLGARVSSKFFTKFSVYASEQEHVIVFKGTTHTSEWSKINAMFFRGKCDIPGTGGYVHSGFLKGFKDLLPALDEVVKTHKMKEKPVVVAGHSLGGSLSILTAKWLWSEHKILVKGVYTFGSPRVGDEEFIKDFDVNVSAKTEIVRTVHADELYDDLITSGFKSKYHHVASHQRTIRLGCVNRHGKLCSLSELHYHFYYIASLARIASTTCGVIKQDPAERRNIQIEMFEPKMEWEVIYEPPSVRKIREFKNNVKKIADQ